MAIKDWCCYMVGNCLLLLKAEPGRGFWETEWSALLIGTRDDGLSSGAKERSNAMKSEKASATELMVVAVSIGQMI